MSGNLTVLLTGATGLVGRFLLAGLLRRRRPTVVLVRPQAHRSIEQRVDEALAAFETHALLPRPIILAGDLTKPGLGLSHPDRLLLAQHRLCILHSAASIRFQADDPRGEPYATNVTGTEQLLALARELSVSQFHHISTAYVQCDRSGAKVALETPLESDAPAGNDYERSKIQAEALVRDCPWLGEKTFYRPSIVVGDSQSGYTSTFHGFYAPLQIASHFANETGLSGRSADAFRERLGLTMRDTKNLVPVDWVAAAVLDLMENRSAHGEIFHLTHPQPASLLDIQAAIVDALEEHTRGDHIRAAGSSEPLEPELFRKQMTVYESYFQNDPRFDRTNAAAFLGHLPCPTMDYARLRRLADFALKSNFGWPRPPVPSRPHRKLSVDEQCSLNPHARPESMLRGINGHSQRIVGSTLELEILGGSSLTQPREPVIVFYRSSSAWKRVPLLLSVDGPSPGPTAGPNRMRVVATEQSLCTCLIEKIDPAQCLSEGRWTIQGVLPANWLEILRDWTQHLSISDVGSHVGNDVGNELDRDATAKP